MQPSDHFLQETLGAMDLVHNLARRLLRNEHDAQDLVQETYLAAYQAWTKRRRPDNVKPWLATICLNLARSHFRRLRRRPIEDLDPDAGAERAAASDTEAEAMVEVERSTVRAAMWNLTENQRVAVTLVDLCGFTTAEAAAAMNTPRGTVLSRVHRGRKALASHVRAEVRPRES